MLKAAGGHYQLDKSKQAKSTPAYWMDVERSRKYFQVLLEFLFSFSTCVCDIDASKCGDDKDNVKSVTVTVASGLQETLWGRQSIW